VGEVGTATMKASELEDAVKHGVRSKSNPSVPNDPGAP